VQASYSEVAEAAFGRPGKLAVDVFLVLSQTGFCVAYVIFIYGNLPLAIKEEDKTKIVLLVIPLQVRPPLRYKVGDCSKVVNSMPLEPLKQQQQIQTSALEFVIVSYRLCISLYQKCSGLDFQAGLRYAIAHKSRTTQNMNSTFSCLLVET
jgi:hypothetical protein